MLVTFTCESYGRLMFFNDIARRLIMMMGHSDTIPGAIKAEQVDKALNNLVEGLTQAKNKIKHVSNDEEQEISLATRAAPLIDMLKSAKKNNCNIIWQ